MSSAFFSSASLEAPLVTRVAEVASTATGAALAREAERQRHLLALLARAPDALSDPALAPLDWARPLLHGAQDRGVAAYRANRHAHAALALTIQLPTVAALLGPASLAALAGAYGEMHPPVHGDLAQFGQVLPAFIEASAQLASEPYLADVARLDQLVALAARAADASPDLASLALLAESEPALLRLRLAPGAAVLVSPHPVVAIWQAHHGEPAAEEADGDRFAEVRSAMAAGHGENAVVWRQGWAPRVAALALADAAFTAAVVAGLTLDKALDAAGADFDFAAWLACALRSGLLLSATVGRAGCGGSSACGHACAHSFEVGVL